MNPYPDWQLNIRKAQRIVQEETAKKAELERLKEAEYKREINENLATELAHIMKLLGVDVVPVPGEPVVLGDLEITHEQYHKQRSRFAEPNSPLRLSFRVCVKHRWTADIEQPEPDDFWDWAYDHATFSANSVALDEPVPNSLLAGFADTLDALEENYARGVEQWRQTLTRRKEREEQSKPFLALPVAAHTTGEQLEILIRAMIQEQLEERYE